MVSIKAYTNLTVVTLNDAFDVLENAYIAIEDDVIKDLGSMSDFDETLYESIIPSRGLICCPGFVNAHTHLGLIPLRSLGEDMPDRLRKFLFPMEMKYASREVVQGASEYAALESLLNGTTTVADMYYYANDVAHVLDRVGIRALVGQTIIDENQIDYGTESNALESAVSFIEDCKKYKRINPMLAPHGTTTVTPQTLKEIHAISKEHDVKVMMHVSEMDYEMTYFNDKSPIEAMNDLGVLDGNFIGVHAIHTSDNDIKILKENSVSIVSCTLANMKSGKGIPRLYEFQEAGVAVGLGTDGPISGNTLDMMGVMKFTSMAQKTKYSKRDILTSKEMLKMATQTNAKILGLKDVGMVEIGYKADLLFVRTDTPTMFPIYDPHAALVYQMQAHDVHTVIVDGVERVTNGKLVTSNLTEVRERLNEVVTLITKDTK